ncbi:dna repair rad16 [Fusarium heterosporum]|uniref:Dna repair rad16 n=1 Tax=Fusarium heterosporum TaxID=42747 RepID=A0A8H5SS13_FUSHE|nr:dna repair rad16 [Fusarium heterosporum]
MSDNGTASMSREELQEELIIQKVVLDSLEDETYDGSEEMRQDAHLEIARLKKLLWDMNQKTQTGTSGENHHDTRYKHPSATPTSDPRNMDPPRQSSFSLPSRKRGADSARLSVHESSSKSRRFSPSPRNDIFSATSSHGTVNEEPIDFVDLTGDDDDLVSDFVAQQIKAEDRQKQEWQDSQLARQLSSQDSPYQVARPHSPHSNAFTRLMSSQPPAASTINDDDVAFHIPGAYDARWDDSLGAGPSFNVPQRQFNPQYIPISTASTQNATEEDPDVIFAGSIVKRSPARMERPTPGMTMGYPDLTRRGQFVPPRPVARPGPSFVPGTFSSPSALASIINRTNNFDPVNGLYQDGSPMPQHALDFLHDSYDHGPGLNDDELKDLLKNISADMDLPNLNPNDAPAGLKGPLYPHQDIALAWMKKMEEGSNKGGILADDMGLGKTISTLALILARPTNTQPKTTLIVAPLALLRQWEEEIASKTKFSHRLSVYLHHGKKTTTEELLRYDVVLTTYGSLAQELKRFNKLEEEHEHQIIDWNDKANSLKCPLLHPFKAKFYRIILDEAQCIKNEKTKSAMACTQLKATYRWCLTGTPMMNGVLELYSLIKFLKIRPYCKWEVFRQGFGRLFGRNGDHKSTAMTKLQALLKAIMLRRKKNSQLNGKPILRLPEKTEEIVYAELSSEERDFYAQLEKHAQVLVNKYLREGTVSKNYSNILVLLLRLRQACCHPHLNLDVDDAGPSSTSITDEEKKQLVKELDAAIVERIKGIDNFECPICYDAVQCPSFFIPCGHDSCGECLVRIAENAATLNIQEGTESNRAKCPVCRGQFDPAKCFSYETFRQVHMPETIEQGSEKEPQMDGELDSDDDSETDSDYASDDEVDNKGNLKDFIINDELSDEEGMDTNRKKSKRKGKGKSKALDVKPSMLKTLRKEAYKNRDAFKKYMRYLRKTWEPAAKVTECMNLLKRIEETGEKTIVFSQWTLLLDLLQVAMSREKMLKPERYDGSMSPKDRNIAAHNFRDRKGSKVMLVSLKAGNAGLNLTSASRVIIMDPFWNPYIEMQAVDRAYRIGQTREVKVYRVLTKDTVEDRIIELQNKKKEMVEAALDENEGGKIGRLGENELRRLFRLEG